MKTQEFIDFLKKEKYDFIKNDEYKYIEVISFGSVNIDKYGVTLWEDNYYNLEDLKCLQKMIEYAITPINERN